MKAATAILLAVLTPLLVPPPAAARRKLQRPVRVVYPPRDARVPRNAVLFLQWRRPYRVVQQFNTAKRAIQARCLIPGTARIALKIIEYQSNRALPIQIGFGRVPSLMTLTPAVPLKADTVYILRLNAKSLGDLRSGLDLREGSLVRFGTTRGEARLQVPVLRKVGLSFDRPDPPGPRSATLRVTAAGPLPAVIGSSVWTRGAIDAPWKKSPWRLAPLPDGVISLPGTLPGEGYYRVTVVPWSVTGHEGLPASHQGPIR
jgi:hypothetical protein